jgi:hypothetical protein
LAQEVGLVNAAVEREHQKPAFCGLQTAATNSRGIQANDDFGTGKASVDFARLVNEYRYHSSHIASDNPASTG